MKNIKNIVSWGLISLSLIISAGFNYTKINDMPLINSWSVIGFILYIIGTVFVFIDNKEE